MNTNKKERNKVLSFLIDPFKGFVIGSSMLLPGIGGGTMAVILGIYERLVDAVSSIRKNPAKSLIFLLKFSIGAGIGMVLFSKAVQTSIEYFKIPMHFLFLGAILGGTPILFKKAGVKLKGAARNIQAKDFLAILLGLAIIFGLFAAIRAVPEQYRDVTGSISVINIIILLVEGFITAGTIVLPGVSTSQVILLFGLYEFLLGSVSNLDIMALLPVVIPLLIGILIGVLLLAKVLDKCLKNHGRFTYLTIAGFVFGSLVDVFPGLPSGMEILYSAVLFLAGLVGIFFLSKASNK